jgi:hypothetical protein
MSIFSGFTAAAGLCMLTLPAYRYIGFAPLPSEPRSLEEGVEAAIESN